MNYRIIFIAWSCWKVIYLIEFDLFSITITFNYIQVIISCPRTRHCILSTIISISIQSIRLTSFSFDHHKFKTTSSRFTQLYRNLSACTSLDVLNHRMNWIDVESAWLVCDHNWQIDSKDKRPAIEWKDTWSLCLTSIRVMCVTYDKKVHLTIDSLQLHPRQPDLMIKKQYMTKIHDYFHTWLVWINQSQFIRDKSNHINQLTSKQIIINWFIFFPSASTAVFQMFNCDGDFESASSYLKADYRLVCDGSDSWVEWHFKRKVSPWSITTITSWVQ